MSSFMFCDGINEVAERMIVNSLFRAVFSGAV